MPASCQIGSGPSLLPSVLLTFGTVPPTAVTHGLSSQVAVSGPALVLPHWALATARFCTTPQSPVAFSTGMPAAAAASGPGSLAWIWMTGSGRPYRTSLTWMNAATLGSFQPSLKDTVVP